MPQEPNNQEVVAELVFDVGNMSEDIKFLGLVTGLDAARDELTGLFDWTCRGCTFRNRTSTIIGSGHPLLARWLCTSCGRMTLVRFRSRANAEWVAQHTLAVAGATLGDTVEPGAVSRARYPGAKPRRGDGQKTFALVAIPALVLIMLLGLTDWRPPASTLTSSFTRGGRRSMSTPSARLPGYWVSESGEHSLCFSRIDPASRTGTYVTVLRNHQLRPSVRFMIVREQPEGEELVIREIDEQGNATGRPETVLYLAKGGGVMIRANLAEEQRVLTMYHLLRYGGVRKASTGSPS
jgi:hypothetical protein